jgi:ubiquinone/menaquinone biosynthesis C-methylase UbiE
MNKFGRELFSLGELYVSDFVDTDSHSRAGKHDMTLVIDERYGAVRMKNPTPVVSMFGKYWYRSGINSSMRKELQSIVQSIEEVHQIKDGDVWLDIACNDGTLLSYVKPTVKKLGIDPADDSFRNESLKVADSVIQDYFSYESYKKSPFGDRKASVVTCIAMFYDLDEPVNFLKDLSMVMDDDGLLVIQMSYTPLMIKQLAFDNICHEHVYYWSLKSITKLLAEVNMHVVDCQLNDVNGGSFRIYIKKDTCDLNKFASAPYRDVCEVRVQSILKWEESFSIDEPAVWIDFYEKINSLKEKTVNFIKSERDKGKKICGYGASTKGNTLLQWFGLDNTLIDAIAERSSYKFGLKTVGTNIPILSEDEVRAMKPDYMIVLPWHFITEFIHREHEYLSNGGKFIIPCPNFQIISK